MNKSYFSLEGKQTLISLSSASIAVLLSFVAQAYLPLSLAIPLALLLSLGLSLVLSRRLTKPITQLIEALINSTQNFKDRDFSITVSNRRSDELGELVTSHNEVAEILRNERTNLYQRELLLEAVFETTPVAMLLTDSNNRVVYGNHQARQLLADGSRLEGFLLNEILSHIASEIALAIKQNTHGFISYEKEGEPHSYYIEQRHFRLNSRRHTLHQIKEMSRELGREEVAIWKKVIRVISHELNNSLAPICSLAHSGHIALEKNNTETLQQILASIAEHSDHLKSFLESYIEFSRLSKPNLATIDLASLLSNIKLQFSVNIICENPTSIVKVDAIQIQQLLINLINNALQADPSQPVKITAQCQRELLLISVSDKGPGMNKEVLQNALLPFYSTKKNGSGLGLSLCREIVEAHSGQIALNNRAEGGLAVSIKLPQ